MESPKELIEWINKIYVDKRRCDTRWLDIISYLGAFEQIKWERDIAIGQLEELGYSLGEKIREEDKR